MKENKMPHTLTFNPTAGVTQGRGFARMKMPFIITTSLATEVSKGMLVLTLTDEYCNKIGHIHDKGWSDGNYVIALETTHGDVFYTVMNYREFYLLGDVDESYIFRR